MILLTKIMFPESHRSKKIRKVFYNMEELEQYKKELINIVGEKIYFRYIQSPNKYEIHYQTIPFWRRSKEITL